MTGTQVRLPADIVLRLIDAFQNQMLVFCRGLLVSHGSLDRFDNSDAFFFEFELHICFFILFRLQPSALFLE